MGNNPVKIWKKKDRELRILMVGLDAAGKTTILYKLKRDVTFKTIPTVGFNVEQFEYKKYTISLWDLGGQDNLRYHWRHFYTGTQVTKFKFFIYQKRFQKLKIFRALFLLLTHQTGIDWRTLEKN